jgi:hypothetical protein
VSKRLFVITTPEIKETDSVSYLFIIRSSAPHEAYQYSLHGIVRLVRAEPNATNPDGTMKWWVSCGHGLEYCFNNLVAEDVPLEKGLQKLLKDIPPCVLLMERNIFDRFEMACRAQNIELGVHHCDEELATS